MTKHDRDDDIIRSTDDLKKALSEAGLPQIPIFEVPKLPQLTEAEKRKIQLEAIRQSRDGRGKQ